MFENLLPLAITIVIDIVKDKRFVAKHRSKLFKLFRALTDAFAQDADARAYANFTFNTPKQS